MSLDLLRAKLANKQVWIRRKYEYYEQKNQSLDPSPIVPSKEKFLYNSTLGWCTKAVDDLSNRLVVDSLKNDEYGMWEIFKKNNRDILFDSAFRSALISACCFIYIMKNDDEIQLQLIDGKNATGTLDPRTYLLKEGYAVLDTDDMGVPTLEAYFTPTETVYINSTNKTQTVVPNPSGYPLLVPVIYRPDADRRPFGQSRISKALMDIQDKARYTITCMEVAREFGAFPQKWVVGLSQDAEFDTLENAYKQILAIDKDADGDKPTVGQFAQISLTSYLSQLQEYERQFNVMSGIDSKESLSVIANGAMKTFGACILNIGLVATSLRDEVHYTRDFLADVEVVWKPVYSIDLTTLNAFGDGIIKINQAVPNAIGADTIALMTGLPIDIDAVNNVSLPTEETDNS